jgi:hypothetical protein
MNRLLLATFLVAIMSSCVNYPIIGYVVCKEHVLQHMSNENAHVVSEASMVYIPVAPHVHHSPPSVVPDKQMIHDVRVSPKTFQSLKLADKVKVFENSIEKIK